MMKDYLCRPLKAGDNVARAYRAGNVARLEIRKVMTVEEGRVFLDHSHVPVRVTENLLIL